MNGVTPFCPVHRQGRTGLMLVQDPGAAIARGYGATGKSYQAQSSGEVDHDRKSEIRGRDDRVDRDLA